MLAALLQAADTLSTAIPSFSDRLNFTLPLVVVLIIVSFFILLKSYTVGTDSETKNQSKSSKQPPSNPRVTKPAKK